MTDPIRQDGILSPPFTTRDLIHAILYQSEGHEIAICRLNIMLARGANPNAMSDGIDSPLYVAAQYNEPGMCKLLIRYGADVNSTGHHGETALAIAAFNRNPDCVRMLLDAGADPDIGGARGRRDGTARHTAWWLNNSMGEDKTRLVREMLGCNPYHHSSKEATA